MRTINKFIISYFCLFAFLSILSTVLLDTSKTYELLAGVIWGNIVYIIVGGVCWRYIFKLTNGAPRAGAFKSFLLGLLTIYLFAFLTSGNLLFLGLFNFYDSTEVWHISIAVHIIYIISYTGGYIISTFL
jgi:hypothetical protein